MMHDAHPRKKTTVVKPTKPSSKEGEDLVNRQLGSLSSTGMSSGARRCIVDCKSRCSQLPSGKSAHAPHLAGPIPAQQQKDDTPQADLEIEENFAMSFSLVSESKRPSLF
jgi:hypothetical protein